MGIPLSLVVVGMTLGLMINIDGAERMTPCNVDVFPRQAVPIRMCGGETKRIEWIEYRMVLILLLGYIHIKDRGKGRSAYLAG